MSRSVRFRLNSIPHESQEAFLARRSATLALYGYFAHAGPVTKTCDTCAVALPFSHGTSACIECGFGYDMCAACSRKHRGTKKVWLCYRHSPLYGTDLDIDSFATGDVQRLNFLWRMARREWALSLHM